MPWGGPQKKLYRDIGPTHVKAKAQTSIPRKTPPSVPTGSSNPSISSTRSARDSLPHGKAPLDDKNAKKGAKKAARAARKAALNVADGEVQPTETDNVPESLPEAVVQDQQLPNTVVPVTKTIVPPRPAPPTPIPPAAPPVLLPPTHGIPGKGHVRIVDTDLQGVRLRI